VTISNTEGNTENCKGFNTYMDMSRMIMEIAILKDRRISSRKVGIGTIITMRMAITPMAIIAELDLADSRNVFVPIVVCACAIIFYPNIFIFFCSYTNAKTSATAL